MTGRELRLIAGALVLACVASRIAEAGEIRAVVSRGRVVYTNLAEENSTVPAARPERVSSSGVTTVSEMLRSIAMDNGVDPDLVHAVVRTESNYDRFAVSSKGALGLMQLIPSTGARFGVKDFFDSRQNLEGGVRYLKFLLEKFKGNLDLTLAAYNSGENRVERLGRVPSIPETRDYVRKVRAAYGKKAVMVPGKGNAVSGPTEMVRAEEPAVIYKTVDSRGVVHFSNTEPPN